MKVVAMINIAAAHSVRFDCLGRKAAAMPPANSRAALRSDAGERTSVQIGTSGIAVAISDRPRPVSRLAPLTNAHDATDEAAKKIQNGPSYPTSAAHHDITATNATIASRSFMDSRIEQPAYGFWLDDKWIRI
jgi:hypothetical protein